MAANPLPRFPAVSLLLVILLDMTAPLIVPRLLVVQRVSPHTAKGPHLLFVENKNSVLTTAMTGLRVIGIIIPNVPVVPRTGLLDTPLLLIINMTRDPMNDLFRPVGSLFLIHRLTRETGSSW